MEFFTRRARAVLIAAAVAGGALFVPGCFVGMDNDNPCTCDANTGGGNNTGGEHVHAWGGWTVTSQATCDAAGVETRTCTLDANHKETREIARLTGEACQSGGGGGSFKTVTIGGQTWMAENLNVVTEGSWCYGEGGQAIVDWDADDNPIFRTLSSSEIQDNCNKYGRLYTWAAAKSACQLIGWKLPSVDDWNILVMGIGVRKEDEYGDVWYEDWEHKLKAKSGWGERCGYDDGCRSYNDGTDDYGFSALPSSIRVPDGVWANNYGAVFYWNMRGGTVLHLWTASVARDYDDRYDENEIIVMRFDNQLSPTIDKRVALPVRCIAD